MNNRYRYICKAKRKDNNEWVGGVAIFADNKAFILNNAKVEFIKGFNENRLNFVLVEVIPETVGQCTGLEDKNGKLIFKGDILHIKTGKGWSCPIGTDIYYKVVFTKFNIECHSCTEYIGFMAERSSGSLSSIYYIVTSYGAEVIGNIYDNPELLEVER